MAAVYHGRPSPARTSRGVRQLASRARRRVRGSDATPDVTRQREVVDAFLAASRGGDFQALLSLLDPDIVVRRTPRPRGWALR
jgi:hypothetical protein